MAAGLASALFWWSLSRLATRRCLRGHRPGEPLADRPWPRSRRGSPNARRSAPPLSLVLRRAHASRGTLAVAALPLLIAVSAALPRTRPTPPHRTEQVLGALGGRRLRDRGAAAEEPGTLTIGTDSPAFEPWFVDDDPTNGKGFESAVAYAVAEELGFAADQVKWVKVRFNNSYKPGAEGLRLRHQPDLDHARARRGRRLLRGLLPRRPGRHRARGHPGAPTRPASPTSQTSSSARRPAPPR